MGDVVGGIGTRYPEIHDSLEARDDVGRLNTLQRDHFGDLSARLSAFNDFRF
jgi:hypothetical protein